MDKAELLSIIRQARALLAERWIPWMTGDGKGGHCHVGCLGVVTGEMPLGGDVFSMRINVSFLDGSAFMVACDAIDKIARELHPELEDAVGARPDLAYMCSTERFGQNPGVFVNNQLGKEAILRVYDEAISRLELEVLCEEEAAKLAAQPVEVEEPGVLA